MESNIGMLVELLCVEMHVNIRELEGGGILFSIYITFINVFYERLFVEVE